MTQYIPKSALIAEIEKIRGNLNLNLRHDQGVCDGLYAIQKAINSLEVKEVDLDKHLKEDIEDVFFDLNGVAVKGATTLSYC